MTKFDAYMAWILPCYNYEFSDKIYYNYKANEFFVRDLFYN